jgi:hypothetical protein
MMIIDAHARLFHVFEDNARTVFPALDKTLSRS